MVEKLKKKFLSIRESSEYTGYSMMTIRRLIAAGKLTPLRLSPGKIILDREEIDNAAKATAK